MRHPIRLAVGVAFLAATGCGDKTAPKTPTGLVAVAGTSAVDLTWDANTEPDLEKYEILRGLSEQDLTLNRVVVPPDHAVTIGYLDNGTTYHFAVRAVDKSGNKSRNSATVSATPQTAAQLASASGAHEAWHFGLVGKSETSASYQWIITNTGGLPAGPIAVAVTGANAADFAFTTTPGCAATLDPGLSCTVTVQATPSVPGLRTALFTASATPGGSTDLLVQVDGAPHLTVHREPPGASDGTVTSVPAGLSCGPGWAMCTAIFPVDTAVTLRVTTTNGGGYHFVEWSGACAAAGASSTCNLVLADDTTAAASILPIGNNLVFVTSTGFPGTLGSATAYDAKCNAAATAAGLNNGTGDAYVAWMSDSSSTAISRLGSARGWQRTDGRPVADLASDLAAGKLFHPILLDEHGMFKLGGYVWTGTDPSGADALHRTCSDWTTTTGDPGQFGERGRGPVAWTNVGWGSCASELPIYCFMKTSFSELMLQVKSGKRMWMTVTSPAPSAGLAAFDALCNSEKPAGLASAKALVATTTAAASSLLTAGTSYVTVSGQLLGTGADFQANRLPLPTGLWQRYDGTFVNTSTAIATGGAQAVDQAGTVATTCNDWSATGGTYGVGSVTFIDAQWFYSGTRACNVAAPLFCFEQ